ncbi:Ig-like domain-containing protein [Pontibacter sp. H249]|uniref:Ig-like domain-containing protein n=1 Tax=Pontibacter sp. H249 TaxID=3133420 RepID=UPI0030C31250
MKKMPTKLKSILCLATAGAMLTLWGCEHVESDVLPSHFTDFKLHDDLLYVYNDRDSRVFSAVNDTVAVYDKITYSQPVHGQLYPNYANDNPNIMGYKPKPGYVGTDSLTYEVCSGGTCKTATIRLVVESRPDPTQCQLNIVADTVITTRNKPKAFRMFLNDEICYGPNGFAVKYMGPEHGTMKHIDYIEGLKNIIQVYHPKKNFLGEDTYTYRVYPNGWNGEYANDYQEVQVKIIVQ